MLGAHLTDRHAKALLRMCAAKESSASHQGRPAVQRTLRITATLSATRSWRRSWTGAPTARGCPASWGTRAAWSTSTGTSVVMDNPAMMDAAGNHYHFLWLDARIAPLFYSLSIVWEWQLE